MAPRVLVVEDETLVREVLAYILADAGYHPDQAADGVEALQAVATHAPDVILLDLNLPGMDGWAFLAQLRSRPALAQIPVLVLSASRRAEWDPSNVAGVMAYLPKPYNPAEVLNEVRFLYEYAQARQSPG